MRVVTVALLCAIAWPAVTTAQVPPPPRPRQPQRQPADTITVPKFRFEPPVSPMGAMWRSLLVPGWGQSVLERRGTGAWFIFFEGLALTMTIKSVHQLHYQEAIGAATVEAKRQEVQDWAVLLAFNHLVAGAEAFVSAHLWDFPGDLTSTVLPSGDLGMGVAIRF